MNELEKIIKMSVVKDIYKYLKISAVLLHEILKIETQGYRRN